MIDRIIDLATGSGLFIDIILLMGLGLLLYVAFEEER